MTSYDSVINGPKSDVTQMGSESGDSAAEGTAVKMPGHSKRKRQGSVALLLLHQLLGIPRWIILMTKCTYVFMYTFRL